MNVHAVTTIPRLSKAEARRRARLREREKHLLAAARLFEDVARQARRHLREARRDIASCERLDYQVEHLFDGVN